MQLRSILQSVKSVLPRFKLKNTLVISAIIFWCCSLIWLWVWGAEFEFFGRKPFESAAMRWFITALYIIIALITFIYLVLKRLRSLQTQQVQTRKENRDPAENEIANQTRYLDHWLIRLKKQLGEKTALYQRPWYILIGTHESGKTTLLKRNCTLTALYTMPISDDPQITCWLSEQAVIFEPHGNLIEQSDNHPIPFLYERLWKSMLNWLVTNRARQPLNGIIVTVDIKQFCTFNREQAENYATLLHNRVREIQQTTQTKLPIFVVFTKLDLLYGFEAMYSSLDKTQRDSLIGATFSISEIDDKKWTKEFDDFWHNWMKQLNAAMPDMMLQTLSDEDRKEIFSFSRQINGIKDEIKFLLQKIVLSSNAKALPLRGVYLTSSIQKGQMEDLFISVVSSQYKLPKRIYPTWQSISEHTYFSRELLNHYLFNEPNLSGENLAETKQYKKRLTLLSIGGIALILFCIGSWQYYFSVNYNAGEHVLEKVKEFGQIQLSNETDDFGNLQLPILNPIHDATLAYGNYHDRIPLLADMGLYQGYKIGPYVETTYLKLLQLRFLPAVMNGLLVQLNNAPKESEEKLKILRVMRMIEDESGRYKDIVMQYMQEVWSREFLGQREVQDDLDNHLSYALDHIKWKFNRQHDDKIAQKTFEPFAMPIKDAQIELRKLSIYQRIYQNLRVKADNDLPRKLYLRSEIGASFDSIFNVDDDAKLYVPQFLTRNAISNYFLKQNDRLIELTAIDSWVLDITNNVRYSKTDREEIDRQINELYISDFISTWNNAYDSLVIKKFADIPEAIYAIEQITSGEQPFRRALVLLNDNTTVKESVVPAANTEKVQALINTKDTQIINRIHKEFAKSLSVLDEKNEQLSSLQNATQKLADLHRYLLTIQNSPSVGQAALKAVQLRVNQNNTDPIFEVQQLAKVTPEPLGRWLFELSNEAWNVIVIEAIRSLEVEWNEKVIKPYKQYIANRYPFNPKAKTDVPLSEFERFFAPKGTLDKFYQQNLKPFIENNLGGNSEVHTLLRADVLKQLALADRIRKTYFTQQDQLGIQFSIQPMTLSGNKRRSILNIDGQLIDYRQSSSQMVKLIWPNSMRTTVESKLTLIGSEARPSSKSITFNGAWSLLRMINAGQLSNITNTSFDLRFTIDGGYIVYRLYFDESDNPFEGRLFSGFALPETLY